MIYTSKYKNYSHQVYTHRESFRKARHVSGIDKKGIILVNLGQFQDETPLNSM